ncbi:MAG: DUF2171 domain-containing protein [Chloroflexi bacterium]|nr:DUF2171 domain-containing protein [Chloroflexota bacterium]
MTHIVVRRGGLFAKEEKVVPIDMVARTTADEIDLRGEAGDLQSAPPFEEKHVVSTEENTDKPTPPAPPVMCGSPVLGMSLQPAPGEQFVTQVEQNIPKGTVALKEGAKVTTAEGKHAGQVERVLADAPTDRATHLLVSTGLLTKESKLVPINWVEMIDEDEVHLRVEKETLDELADTSVVIDRK